MITRLEDQVADVAYRIAASAFPPSGFGREVDELARQIRFNLPRVIEEWKVEAVEAVAERRGMSRRDG